MARTEIIALLFLLGFMVHNIEEAVWLPKWSKHAGRFHAPVRPQSFYFAVIIVTVVGVLLTFQYFLVGDVCAISRYAYLGFVSMMVLNAVFPHLVATIALRRYAPGTLTALLLNIPIGTYIVFTGMGTDKREWEYLLGATALLSTVTLVLIHRLFRIADRLFDKEQEK